MLIKASTMLRNDYGKISALAKSTKKPIYITRNGEGDLVIMAIDAFEEHEQMLELRSKVLDAEERRLKGETGVTIKQARKILMVD